MQNNNEKEIIYQNITIPTFSDAKFNFSELFLNSIENLKINKFLSNDKLQKFTILTKILLEDKGAFYKSLSNILSKEDIELKHYLDSLTILALQLDCWQSESNSSKIIDIGTGAGFPAVPLAIAMPFAKITAVDSKNKSYTFVQNLINQLNLKNLNVICERAENLGHDQLHRENYDITISRAVSNISTLLELMAPLTKVGGYIIMYKGPNYEEELLKAKNAISLLNLSASNIQVCTFAQPQIPFTRCFIIIKKNNHTPNKYPRKVCLPFSKPL